MVEIDDLAIIVRMAYQLGIARNRGSTESLEKVINGHHACIGHWVEISDTERAEFRLLAAEIHGLMVKELGWNGFTSCVVKDD